MELERVLFWMFLQTEKMQEELRVIFSLMENLETDSLPGMFSPLLFLNYLFLKRYSAYVTQMDVLFPTSTVKEAILFSALCRLPEKIPYEDKTAFVDGIPKFIIK